MHSSLTGAPNFDLHHLSAFAMPLIGRQEPATPASGSPAGMPAGGFPGGMPAPTGGFPGAPAPTGGFPSAPAPTGGFPGAARTFLIHIDWKYFC